MWVRRRAEIEELLVEGLPVGLERELSADAGPPAAAYPFLLRRRLRDFLQALDAHAKAVRGAAPAGEGSEGAAEAPFLAADSSSGAEEGALAPACGALRRHWLLLGPRGSGKSVLLGLAAAWARANGWLVLYVPRARHWVQGGLYYPHPHAPPPAHDQGAQQPWGARCSLWDTPVQAQQVLEVRACVACSLHAPSPLAKHALWQAGQPGRADERRLCLRWCMCSTC